MSKLLIGKEMGLEPFYLPDEMVARTLAIIGQRGSGKSSTATVIAEEFCKSSLPWMALDPVGVWWGLRAKADGSAGGFPVVVFGGERGDLPLEKGQGRKIAEACVAANVFAVIDLSRDSKTTWRTIVRDFCHALQELRPSEPRHVFLEEAPEFVPQRASHQLGAECKEIVERLVRLGRNWGYGATVLSQRPATVDKDVLSQCETLFVMRTSGAHDRKALKEWMAAHQTDKAEAALDSLASLPDGTGWLWSPQWLKLVAKIDVRKRETFHPGATRTVGAKAKSIEMVDVQSFVERVRKQLTKTVASVCPPTKNEKTLNAVQGMTELAARKLMIVDDSEMERLRRDLELKDASIARLDEALRDERGKVAQLTAKLDTVRKHLQPQFDTLNKLFTELGALPPGPAAVAGGDPAVWEPWLLKAGQRGCRRMLQVLIERGELTRNQLGTLSNVASTKSTFRNYLSWMKNNGLIETDGEKVRLRAV